MSIDGLLQPLQKFGIHLGLERSKNLLDRLGNPHHSVPIAHIAGTNGKGSVCAYLSSVLTVAGYKVGRYTSPHLIDWTERICLNERAIASEQLEAILREVIDAIAPEMPPTQFEVFTAAAWLYFAREKVDIAIMEVGLGGRLDATNVCPSPLVTAIVSISRDHWQILGDSLAEIAGEKAGILKPHCPAIIGKIPLVAAQVIQEKIKTLDCPAIWVEPAEKIAENEAKYHNIQYELPLAGDIQFLNSAIAIAMLQVLQKKGWRIPRESIQTGIAKTRWPGRLQWVSWQQKQILIDGAHNHASAQILRQYVDTLNQPIAWILGILTTKDQPEILAALLKPRDRLYLVPVPHPDSTEPEQLAEFARQVCPNLSFCQTDSDFFLALNAAIATDYLVVVSGSLYLVGYFLEKTQTGFFAGESH